MGKRKRKSNDVIKKEEKGTWIRRLGREQITLQPLDAKGYWKIDVAGQEEPELGPAHNFFF